MVYVESNRDPVCVRGETMKPCYAVVALLLLLSPVLGATISNTFSAQVQQFVVLGRITQDEADFILGI